MSSIYARLGFNSSDTLTNSTTQELSANVKTQLNMLPNLLTPWQIEDIATSNTSGYYVNPVANIISYIVTTANNMLNISEGVTGTTNAITLLIRNTANLSNTIIESTAPGFLYHTNRLSNVIAPDVNVDEVHYQTAIGTGKIMVYIVNQSDGIQNNSPIMGNFTSLYTSNTLSQQKITVDDWAVTLNNSISITTTTVGGNTVYIQESNFSLTQAQNMYDSISALNQTMINYRNQDNTFYQNSKAVLEDFNKVRDFSKLGQSETDMIMNAIGSDKIKQRLNS